MDIGFKMIEIFFEGINPIEISKATRDWLKQSAEKEHKTLGKISYIFCDDEYLLNINKIYLDHDYYTDIITFDYVRGKTVSGDIFVSLPRIQDNSERLQTVFQEELKRVLAHGILHLCGYKDKTDEEQAQMRFKEEFYLKSF